MPIPILKGFTRDRKLAPSETQKCVPKEVPQNTVQDYSQNTLPKKSPYQQGTQHKITSRTPSPAPSTLIPRTGKSNASSNTIERQTRTAGISRTGLRYINNANVNNQAHIVNTTTHSNNNNNANNNYTNNSNNNNNSNSNKESMLDKFKLLNIRDKSKDKEKNRASTCSNSSTSSSSTLSSMSTTSSHSSNEGNGARSRLALPTETSTQPRSSFNSKIRNGDTSANISSLKEPTKVSNLNSFQPSSNTRLSKSTSKDNRNRLELPKPSQKIPTTSDSIKPSSSLIAPKKIADSTIKNTDKKSSLLRNPVIKPTQPITKQPYPKKLTESTPRNKELPSTKSRENNFCNTLESTNKMIKPTAAIKGTTKVQDKNAIKSPLSPELNKRGLQSPYTHHRSLSPSVLDSPKRREDGYAGAVSVALVSPMPSRHNKSPIKQNLENDASCMKMNAVEKVLDEPERVKQDVEKLKALENPMKLDPINNNPPSPSTNTYTTQEDTCDCEENDGDDTLLKITPMEPLQGAMHYNYVKGLSEFLSNSNPPPTTDEKLETDVSTIPLRSSKNSQLFKRYSQPANLTANLTHESIKDEPPGKYSHGNLDLTDNRRDRNTISDQKLRRLKPQSLPDSPKVLPKKYRLCHTPDGEDLPTHFPGETSSNYSSQDGSTPINSLGIGSIYNPQRIKSHSINGSAAQELSRNIKETILNAKLNKGDGKSRIKSVDESLDSLSSEKRHLSKYPFNTSYSWLSRTATEEDPFSTPSIRSISSTNIIGEDNAPQNDPKTGGSEAPCSDQFDEDQSTFREMGNKANVGLLTSTFLRSSSVRGCRSDYLYGRGALSSAKSEDLYSDQLFSRYSGRSSARLSVPPASFTRGSSSYSTVIPRTFKDDQGSGRVLGSSSGSLGSSTSGGSSCEDFTPSEIMRLKRELIEAQNKNHDLATKLESNAQLVAAFEQSLGNMTNRIYQLTASSKQKDCKIQELQKTIEIMACKNDKCEHKHTQGNDKHHHHHRHRHHSTTSNSSVNTLQNGESLCASEHGLPDMSSRRHTYNGAYFSLTEMSMAAGGLWRGPSSESICSLTSNCSAASASSAASNWSSASCYSTCSATSNTDGEFSRRSKKKGGWLRSSFSKAFSRKKNKASKGAGCDIHCSGVMDNDCHQCMAKGNAWTDTGSNCSIPPPSPSVSQKSVFLAEKSDMTSSYEEETVKHLQDELQSKDAALTEIRLEALTSAHQVDSLKETIGKLHAEMLMMKSDGQSKNSNTSKNKENGDHFKCLDKEIIDLNSTVESTPSLDELLLKETKDEGKSVNLKVVQSFIEDFEQYLRLQSNESPLLECSIGELTIYGKTKWSELDKLIYNKFVDYIKNIDPDNSLGLSIDSISAYYLGEISRSKDLELPELLPYGYLIGNVQDIKIVLRGSALSSLDSLAFETLIPRSNLSRYVSLLTEHRRIILCGPAQIGKSYMANKLAEFLVRRLGLTPSSGNIANFTITEKNCNEIRSYLSHLNDQSSKNTQGLPLVIILDELHNVGSLSQLFNGTLNSKVSQCPIIIGTTNQTSSQSITDLQLQYNFRWILLSRMTEPCFGLANRLSRQVIFNLNPEEKKNFIRILYWLPQFYSRASKILNNTDFSDVPLGPGIITNCPEDLKESEDWFINLWNHSLGRNIAEAVCYHSEDPIIMETWQDLSDWMRDTYPWEKVENSTVELPISLDLQELNPPSLSSMDSNDSR